MYKSRLNSKTFGYGLFDYIVLLIVMSIIALVLYLYFNHFNYSISNQQEVWGQFGDFVGGLLNPIIAFAAFVYLWISVGIQRRELADASNSLKSTQLEQQKQALIIRASVEMESIYAKMQSAHSLTALYYQQIQYAQQIMSSSEIDKSVYDERRGETIHAGSYIADIQDRIRTQSLQDDEYRDQLNNIQSKLDKSLERLMSVID
ncbi:MAG: hypothetical protein ABJI60_14295 [Kangiellaceae bacterium]